MFTGCGRDDETGLDYAENRFYSSSVGRYASTDPMPSQQGHLPDPPNLNRYAYVNNNPLQYVAPPPSKRLSW